MIQIRVIRIGACVMIFVGRRDTALEMVLPSVAQRWTIGSNYAARRT
jgi:hypothetical protein